MPPLLRRLESASKLLGVDLRQGLRTLRGLGRFAAQHHDFVRQSSRLSTPFPRGKLYPCVGDDEGESGSVGGHYFHQDLYVAQRIFQRAPRRHVDVGSRVDGFVGHVASFREIEVFDIRALTTSARNIRFRTCDAMGENAFPVAYTDSVSCLHALEHFGLGRYGDPLDPLGHVRGFRNLVRVLEPGGILYLSVPLGPQRIEFNAHRVFSAAYVLELAAECGLEPLVVTFIDDGGELHDDAGLAPDDVRRNYGCYFGCGIYELQKPDHATSHAS